MNKRRTKGVPEDSKTRKRAILRFCHECMGYDEHPRTCKERGRCSLHPYRPGIRARDNKRKQPIIRQCYECQGNRNDARNCHSIKCPLNQWRPGQKDQALVEISQERASRLGLMPPKRASKRKQGLGHA